MFLFVFTAFLLGVQQQRDNREIKSTSMLVQFNLNLFVHQKQNFAHTTNEFMRDSHDTTQYIVSMHRYLLNTWLLSAFLCCGEEAAEGPFGLLV